MSRSTSSATATRPRRIIESRGETVSSTRSTCWPRSETSPASIECKAWRSAIEKDVVYNLEGVMRECGLSKGIVVSIGGLRSGARVAAERAHIEIWGPDEVRSHLGDEALAGLPLSAPDAALGVPVVLDRVGAEREIGKARGGFAGIGSEDLVWVPCFEFQLAITRLRPGLISDKEELIRRWALFEALTGRLVGARDDARAFESVELDAPAIRQQRSGAQVLAEVRKVLGKHRNAKSDAAQKVRKTAYNAVGLPGSTREFAVEDEKLVYVPFSLWAACGAKPVSGSSRSTPGTAPVSRRSNRRCTARSTFFVRRSLTRRRVGRQQCRWRTARSLLPTQTAASRTGGPVGAGSRWSCGTERPTDLRSGAARRSRGVATPEATGVAPTPRVDCRARRGAGGRHR